jgi:hypothetical protein
MQMAAARLSCYLHDEPSAFRIELAGALSERNVAELERCWRTGSSALGARDFVVDLDCLVSIDDPGRRLLQRWRQLGARFVAESLSARSILESMEQYLTGLKAANY